MIPEDELTSLTALALGQAIRRREVAIAEVVHAFLERIVARNSELSAFIQVYRHRAMLAARLADRSLRNRGGPTEPLFGVPIAIKDTNLVRGARTRFGSRGVRFLFSPVDDRVVRRIRHAGMSIVGKTSTSELGVMPIVEPDLHAPTRNPWNPQYSAGGSSGGSAAAVAGGLLPIAHGTDGAGSIRLPSCFCGLVGLKPTRGLLPSAFGEPEARLMYTSGPIAQNVEDAAALLDVMARTPRDPRFLESCRTAPRRLNIRLVLESPVSDCDPRIAAETERIGRLLSELGHRVTSGTSPRGSVEEFLPLYGTLSGGFPLMDWKVAQPVTRWVADQGKSLRRGDFNRRFDELKARLDGWMEGCDLVLSPTCPEGPPRVGAWALLPPDQAFLRAARLGAYTAFCNITGQPALTLPIGLGPEGIPFGVQLAGQVGQDELVLSLAYELEAKLGAVLPSRPRDARAS